MMRQRGLQRRTPLTAKTPLERGARPLRSSGPTKARRRPQSAEEKEAKRLTRARSGGWCEIQLPGCWGRAFDFSHRIAAGRGGKWLASNGCDACRWCHLLITNTNGHRAEYEAAGWIVRTNADPATVAVSIRGQWVYLTESGEYVAATNGAVA